MIKTALTAKTGICALFLQTALAFERNQHAHIDNLVSELEIPSAAIRDSYLAAVKYANSLI